MIIKVKKPGDCPLRVFVGGKFACFVKNNSQDLCGDAMNFPNDCPLHSRMVCVEKEDSGVKADPPPPPEPPSNVERNDFG